MRNNTWIKSQEFLLFLKSIRFLCRFFSFESKEYYFFQLTMREEDEDEEDACSDLFKILLWSGLPSGFHCTTFFLVLDDVLGSETETGRHQFNPKNAYRLCSVFLCVFSVQLHLLFRMRVLHRLFLYPSFLWFHSFITYTTCFLIFFSCNLCNLFISLSHEKVFKVSSPLK